ncbi:MAG TPA: dTMP kinase [Thermoanaerobaculia bacterium]|nr:dTMP kinase [Thermoanaerobaculia bacterium]
MFISFEGPEGSGKTTQIGRLAEQLRRRGVDCVVTKEPGGTPLADRIRAILLHPESSMDRLTELLLYAASRRQHVIEVIRPALDRGAVVLCDRFTDATLAYQGFGRLLDLDRLRTLNEWVTGGLHPDLTLLYDIDEEAGLRRAQSRNARAANAEGRFEREDIRFHRRVREGYLALATAEPRRFVVLDAEGSIDEVFERTLAVLRERAPEIVR